MIGGQLALLWGQEGFGGRSTIKERPGGEWKDVDNGRMGTSQGKRE